jgi:hypothetical protein
MRDGQDPFHEPQSPRQLRIKGSVNPDRIRGSRNCRHLLTADARRPGLQRHGPVATCWRVIRPYQLFFLPTRAIAPAAGAIVSQSPIVTTMDVM